MRWVIFEYNVCEVLYYTCSSATASLSSHTHFHDKFLSGQYFSFPSVQFFLHQPNNSQICQLADCQIKD